MKLTTVLLAVTLAAFAASSAITFAAEGLPADTKSETKAKIKKPVKKHSHMEEKTGMPMSEPVAGSTTSKPDKPEADKHDHTKDRH